MFQGRRPFGPSPLAEPLGTVHRSRHHDDDGEEEDEDDDGEEDPAVSKDVSYFALVSIKRPPAKVKGVSRGLAGPKFGYHSVFLWLSWPFPGRKTAGKGQGDHLKTDW